MHESIPSDADYQLFETALAAALGEWVRNSLENAEDLWSAITERDWIHRNGTMVHYTFRHAENAVNEIYTAGGGNDCASLFMCGPAGHVTQHIADALAAYGWRSRPMRC